MQREENCELHGPYQSNGVPILGGSVIWTRCPKCEELQRNQEEKAELQRQRESKIRHGIEPEFFGATLQNYKAETESERMALQAAKDLESGRIKKLLLLGSNGTGKTHLGCAICQSQGGVRITMFELSALIRRGYTEGYSELKVLDDLLSYPVIVIDEVGRTKGSEAEKNWMSYLVDKAHTRGIRLVMISNRSTARNLPPERRGEAFENYFDNDVISRLRQDSKIVEIKGRDRRAGAGKVSPAETTAPAV